jgi:hypothetical protein
VARLYTYIVQRDSGLAPNPYWDWCTLAVCTPNHQGSRIEVGDWIAGFLNKARGHRFLYALEVAEIIDLDDYFHDPRFQSKKPNLRGDWRQRCGDNFYSRQPDGTWIQHRNAFHIGDEIKQKDTKHAKAFTGKRFWYLGRSASKLPARFRPLAGGRGARVNHDPKLVTEFKKWVEHRFSPGISDLPNDNPGLLKTSMDTTGALSHCSGRPSSTTKHRCS